jgi:uncharacterized membrane protein YsdA (DUF1294 family)
MLGILLTVYVLAINFYAFLFMRRIRKEKSADIKKHDMHLLLVALLGGGLTIYVCMFIFKTRLENLLVMIAVPVLIAVHAYVWFFGFRYGFSIPRWR